MIFYHSHTIRSTEYATAKTYSNYKRVLPLPAPASYPSGDTQRIVITQAHPGHPPRLDPQYEGQGSGGHRNDNSRIHIGNQPRHDRLCDEGRRMTTRGGIWSQGRWGQKTHEGKPGEKRGGMSDIYAGSDNDINGLGGQGSCHLSDESWGELLSPEIQYPRDGCSGALSIWTYLNL